MLEEEGLRRRIDWLDAILILGVLFSVSAIIMHCDAGAGILYGGGAIGLYVVLSRLRERVVPRADPRAPLRARLLGMAGSVVASLGLIAALAGGGCVRELLIGGPEPDHRAEFLKGHAGGLVVELPADEPPEARARRVAAAEAEEARHKARQEEA